MNFIFNEIALILEKMVVLTSLCNVLFCCAQVPILYTCISGTDAVLYSGHMSDLLDTFSILSMQCHKKYSESWTAH